MFEKKGSPPPEVGNTSVRFGPAFLRPSPMADHYELMRPIITVINEADRVTTEQHGDPIGPIAIYRIKGKGDVVDMTRHRSDGPPAEMKTFDAKLGPLALILCWWPGMGEM